MAASDILFTDVSKLLFSDVRNLFEVANKDMAERSVAAWLAGSADAPPETIAFLLAERLAEALAHQPDPRKRLTLIATAEAAAQQALAAIEQATEATSLPLPQAAKQAAVAADSLLKALATGYAGVALDIRDKGALRESGDLLHLAVLHAMQALVRRGLLAYRGQAVPSPTSWQMMQDTYLLAREQGLAGTAASSVDTLYVAALLFALADPGRLPRASLAAAHAFVAELAPRGRIVAASAATGDPAWRFLIIGDKGRPAQPLAQAAKSKVRAPGALVLDCAAIVSEMERLTSAGAGTSLPLETLELLRDAWSAAAAPQPLSAAPIKPRVELIGGLPTILRLVAGKPPVGSGKEASEWLVMDETPDGFVIQHLGGEASSLAIGDLVALRPREHGKIHLCLVRRRSNGAREHLELGVQLMSSTADVIPLPAEDILAIGQQGLLLPQLPAFGNAAGVVTAAGALSPSSIVTTNECGTMKYYRLGSRIATSTAVDFFLLKPA